MENLAEKLQQANDQSFDKWFERWFQKQHFDKVFEQSSQQGYTGYILRIGNSNDTSLGEDKEYLNRRLRDKRVVEKLKEKLPGIKVEYVKKEWDSTTVFHKALGTTSHSWKDHIHFSWK